MLPKYEANFSPFLGNKRLLSTLTSQIGAFYLFYLAIHFWILSRTYCLVQTLS